MTAICTICIEELVKPMVTPNGCPHRFHLECMNKWVQSCNQKSPPVPARCPVCRNGDCTQMKLLHLDYTHEDFQQPMAQTAPQPSLLPVHSPTALRLYQTTELLFPLPIDHFLFPTVQPPWQQRPT